MMKILASIKNHIKENNIIFAKALGLCPALAVSSNAKSAFLMGALTLVVLVVSSFFISVIRKTIPSQARIPIFVVIIAGFVCLADIIMQAYFIEGYKLMGLFLPLIVVNCSVLANIESGASKHGILKSTKDSTIAGLGFTFAITFMGIVREFLALGEVFGQKIFSGSGMLIFTSPAGAFIVLGLILALINSLKEEG